MTMSPFTQISPSPSSFGFSILTSQHGSITPTVEGQGVIDKLDPLTYNEVYVSN